MIDPAGFFYFLAREFACRCGSIALNLAQQYGFSN